MDRAVSIVIPCLNEERTIGACVLEALRGLEKSGLSGEVLVIDNGSTDRSAEIVRASGGRLVDCPRRGYGAALQYGIATAAGPYVFMADADQSYDFTEVGRFVTKLEEGYDIVVGCRLERYGGTIDQGAMPLLHRLLGNPFLSLVGRILFHVPIHDMYCGLRAFRKEAVSRLNCRAIGMEFALEMLVRGALAKLTMAELPITLRRDGREGGSHLRTWIDGWRSLRYFLLMAPNWLFLGPGLVLLIGGLIALTLTASGPFVIGNVGFDLSSMVVFSALTLVGLQVVLLAIVAQVFASLSGLLPSTPRIERLLGRGPCECGILVGLVLFTTGAILIAKAFLGWRATGFGVLSYPDTLRVVVPGATLLASGCQFVFGGFLLQLLSMWPGVEDVPQPHCGP